MAKCIKEVVWPDVVVTQPPSSTEIVLRLSEDEASVLNQVINQIGGDPCGPRGVLDEIRLALYRAGVVSTTHKVEIHHVLGSGTPYFCIEKGDE